MPTKKHAAARTTALTVLGVAAILAGSVFVQAAEDAGEAAYEFKVPLGLDIDAMVIPENNPMSQDKVDLGELLYFDTRLSADNTVSCATCHDPRKGFTDQDKVSTGIDGQKGGRSAPSVINSAFYYFQFWDGRAPDLEAQAVGPIENPIEMGNTHDKAVETIAGIEGYKPLFEKAFGDSKVSIDRIGMAIASYERTVLSGNSAWDRYVDGDKKALSESAARGLELFEGKANCTRCHVGFNLTDSLFHNLGVGMSAEKPDLGRYDVTKEEADKGAFKTPMLRDLKRTAPYMHDGSEATLMDVVEFYDKGGEKNAWLDPKMVPLGLNDTEKGDLVAFLESLEGDWKFEGPSDFPQ